MNKELPISDRIFKIYFDLKYINGNVEIKSEKDWAIKRIKESFEILHWCDFQNYEYLLINGTSKNEPIGIIKASDFLS